MTFREQLNIYISQLGCTAKELSDASGLSPSVISRYRSGSRTPDAENLQRIIQGILRLAEERGMAELTQETVSHALEATLMQSAFPYDVLQKNLNALLSALTVNVSDLAHALNYDTSYLSRIRNGQRHPAEPNLFAAEIARYILRRYPSLHERAIIAQLIGCNTEQLMDDSIGTSLLTGWLIRGDSTQKDLVHPFLTKDFIFILFTMSIVPLKR